MAAYEAFVVREQKSHWLQIHIRQALWFGILAGTVALVALVWPLVLTAIVGATAPPSALIGATIWIYVLAFILDLAVFAIFLILALRYSRRAARGEMFEVPYVAPITRRVGVKR